jgi:hypothetical protein
MTDADRKPVSVWLATTLQLTQTLAALFFFTIGASIAHGSPNGFHGVSHKKLLVDLVLYDFPIVLWSIWASILLVMRRKAGWWLAVAWNLVGICVTLAIFVDYLRQGIWALSSTIFLLLPLTLDIGCLFARSTRRYLTPLNSVEAMSN